jgi:electron transport complex protein RnfG
MLDKLKVAAVLLVIGAISGGLIWGVNELTAGDIETNAGIREQALYRTIFNISEDETLDIEEIALDGVLTKEVIIYDANDHVVGRVFQGYDTNNYGDITVLVGVNTDNTIQNVAIQETTNTVTFVKKIENNYLAPFSNQDVLDISYDSKTGATYTYSSVSKIVNAVSRYVDEHTEVSEEAVYHQLFNLDATTTLSFDETPLDGVVTNQVAVYNDDTLIGHVYEGYDENAYGDVTVLVAVDPEGLIAAVIIDDSSNTVSFVQLVEENFLAPFVDQEIASVEFDTSTGASFTYTSVATIVEAVSDLVGGAAE